MHTLHKNMAPLKVVGIAAMFLSGASAFSPVMKMYGSNPALALRSSTPSMMSSLPYSVTSRSMLTARKDRLGQDDFRKQRRLVTSFSMQVQPPDAGAADADSDEQTFSTAIRNTGFLVAAAALFGSGVYAFMGPDAGLSWFTGYILEESLSVDNLFVFILLFNYFKVPRPLQTRVLKWGIIGACALRGIFIGAGIVAINSFRPVLLAFAGFLVFSSYKMLTSGDDDDDDSDLSNNDVVKFASSIVNSTTTYDGDRFFTMVDGVKRATPLLLVLVCVELSDILFAVDSIPAIFGVTEDPFIIFTSNIFAILGLRALFQVVSRLMENLDYLEPAVALVLGFVGVKMIAEFGGVSVSEEAALGVVVSILSGGVGLSLWKKREGGASD